MGLASGPAYGPPPPFHKQPDQLALGRAARIYAPRAALHQLARDKLSDRTHGRPPPIRTAKSGRARHIRHARDELDLGLLPRKRAAGRRTRSGVPCLAVPRSPFFLASIFRRRRDDPAGGARINALCVRAPEGVR